MSSAAGVAGASLDGLAAGINDSSGPHLSRDPAVGAAPGAGPVSPGISHAPPAPPGSLAPTVAGDSSSPSLAAPAPAALGEPARTHSVPQAGEWVVGRAEGRAHPCAVCDSPLPAGAWGFSVVIHGRPWRCHARCGHRSFVSAFGGADLQSQPPYDYPAELASEWGALFAPTTGAMADLVGDRLLLPDCPIPPGARSRIAVLPRACGSRLRA